MRTDSPRRRPCARRLAPGLALIFAALMTGPVLASESGRTYFAHGGQVAYAGFMPAPGTVQVYGYSLFYDVDSLRDNEGNSIPGVSAEAFALAPRAIYTFEQPWHGYKVSVGGLAQALHLGLNTPMGQFFDNGALLFGLEAYLSRSFGNFHVMGGLMAYLPWGNYDPNAVVNVMFNRYGGAINTAVSWVPTPRWDVSLTLGHEFKGRNRDTQYRDGQQTGLTYGVAYRPFEDTRWDLGFSGYYTVQVEDDRQSGVTVEGQRLRKVTIGPKASFWFNPTAAVIVQWQKEYEVRNAPRGDQFWLMTSFRLGS